LGVLGPQVSDSVQYDPAFLMNRTTTGNFTEMVADAILAERFPIAAQWLARLNEILEVGPRQVFPSASLLDHIPLLIAEIAEYLRAPESEEIAANTTVIEKARELGLLRHAQHASVHQLLREYEILGEILEAFISNETARLQLEPTPTQCFDVLRRLSRAIRILMRTTVDTFVAEFTAALQERNERIDKFNRMTSHELRTPIGTLTFAAELLGNDVIRREPQRLGQVAAVVRNNVERLAWLIENLQRVARLDDGVNVPSRQRVEVTTLATVVVRQLEEMAAARDVHIQVQPALPVLETDPARLELVLLNLVSNGIKYSDPAKTDRFVRIRGDEAIAADGTWRLVVLDNGLGIPASAQQAIFDRFFRAHEHLDAKLGVSGSGLGLSIVADCVAALGGEIAYSSEPGDGTTFTVTLRGVSPPST
jgi:signal transduction histidine kinase